MFHFLAESIQAYNQAGLFFGALICLSIGGFFLGDAFYWRVHAIRASATIIGVLAKNGVYTPVYRYAVQGGQSHLARSDTGSNSVRGKETGRTVSLMISAIIPLRRGTPTVIYSRSLASYFSCQASSLAILRSPLIRSHS
jgi:hypothetical protein